MKKNILIYYTGSLGDLLILVPVFGAIRNAHPDDKITLLNIHDGGEKFAPARIVEKGGIVDELRIWTHKKVKIVRYLRFLLFFCRPFMTRYSMVYDCGRDGIILHKRIKRDCKFLQAYAPGAIIRGAVQLRDFLDPKETLPRIGDLLLERFNHDGLEPQLTAAANDVFLNDAEKSEAEAIFNDLKIPAGKIPLAVGPGGKKTVCRYPVESYISVLKTLVAEDRIFPIFFGGPEDNADITEMTEALGFGNSARMDHRNISLRTSIALIGKCTFYLGNDTGTLHLAAASGITCVIVSSSHNNPGLWMPLGDTHLMLRSDPECRGCRKKDCPIETPPPCLKALTPEIVIDGIRSKLYR